MNYKVLVLDDEPKQRKGITAKLMLTGSPINVIGEAGDGIEGLELIALRHPDIIITDIRMPEMDGLVFIEQAKKMNPDLFFVIVSGYSDFEFAKKAIKYGVYDYLLKPIDVDELSNIVADIVNKLGTLRESQFEVEQMKHNNRTNMEGLRQQWLTRMMHAPVPSNFTEQSIAAVSDVLGKFPFMLVIVLEIEPYLLPHYSFNHGDEPLIHFAIDNIMLDQMKSAGKLAIGFQHAIHQNEMVYLLGVEHPDEHTLIKKWLDGALYGVSEYLKLHITIAIGSTVDRFDLIMKSYQTATLSLRNRIIKGSNQVYDYAWIQTYAGSEGPLVKEEDETLLFALLNQGEEISLGRWVEQRIHDLVDSPRSTYSHLEWFCADVYLLLRKFLLGKTQDTRLIIGEMNDLQYWLQNLTDWRDAISEIQNQITNVFHFLSTDYQTKDLMEEIKQYLVVHMKEDISLQTIAERFFIHPTYFSKRFIDKFGQGYLDFLTHVRMEKAAEWLKESNMKIQEIAELVGYEGAAYFSTVFKKTFGVSPKEYRQTQRT